MLRQPSVISLHLDILSFMSDIPWVGAHCPLPMNLKAQTPDGTSMITITRLKERDDQLAIAQSITPMRPISADSDKSTP